MPTLCSSLIRASCPPAASDNSVQPFLSLESMLALRVSSSSLTTVPCPPPLPAIAASALYTGFGPFFSPFFSDLVNSARTHPLQAIPWDVSAVSAGFCLDFLNSLPSHAFRAFARDVSAVLMEVATSERRLDLTASLLIEESSSPLIEEPSFLLNSLLAKPSKTLLAMSP